MNAFTLRIIILALLTAAIGHGAVRAKLSSGFVARGEQCIFEIRVEGQEPDTMPRVPLVKDVAIESIGFGRPQMFPGRRIESSFQFLVSSYAVGAHVIPPVEVMVDGVKHMTDPVRLEVFDPSDLKWAEAASQPAGLGETVRYASIIRIPQKKIYTNQAVPAEIKIYVPEELASAVADWGVPEFERKGLAVWRFEPSDPPGRVNLLGSPYVSISYQTSMNALAPGEVEIGPATVRLTYVRMVFDGFTRRVNVQATLDVPKLAYEVAALPEGAPEGFDNAVGKFTIGTSISETDVTEGEPLALDVIVSGSGNLDNLRTPQMVDPAGWKVYEASQTQRGEERREVTGSVVFSQFIRPLEMKSAVPPFRLVYFDPDEERYVTVTTEGIPLNMKPAAGGRGFESSGPPQALPLPVERMTDILGAIKTGGLLSAPGSSIPTWLPHALAAALALALIGKALWMRYGYLFEKDEVKIAKRRDFEKLSKVPAEDGLGFLRAAGGFAERWLAGEGGEEIRGIIEERDRLCFRAKNDVPGVPNGRRSEILRSLRRAAFGVLILALTLPSANAGDVSAKAMQAYEAAKFDEAAKLWLQAGPYEQLSADTLYNIGNASYRMGAPGQAALYYRRALARDSSHGEARQNLRFLERKYGAITIERPAYQYVLARFPLAAWKGALWCGLWLVALGLLAFPATRPGSRLRVAGVVGFVLGPLMISLGGLGWRYFPDDAGFAPLAMQAVIVGEKVVLHADAARTSPEVIDAPAGSLAEVIRRSGRWAYVGFATKTRGWVPVESIEMIIPRTPPEPPKVRKTAADGSSA
ncbi:BatD family protein [Akkermansiaceae bacterium]|nr:BatD family protein [Akkermansiaceae bacterium]